MRIRPIKRHRTGSCELMARNCRTFAMVGMLSLTLPWAASGAPDVVSIWGGARGTVVRKSDGTVWTWGANFAGKLGIGMSSTNLARWLVPVEVHGRGDAGLLT